MKTYQEQREWRQFIKLGEMIGDGMHNEDKWILDEYNELQKKLLKNVR